MPSNNNSKLSAPGTTANDHDWAFQGNTYFDPIYEGDFDADIDAITESIEDDHDSGYFSNDTDSFEPRIKDGASNNDPFRPAEFGYQPSLQPDTFYEEEGASNMADHGSIYDGALNKSTTHLEKGFSMSKQRGETRMSQTVQLIVQEYEPKNPHEFSYSLDTGGSRPCALEQWAKTEERHERIACGLAQPANFQSSKQV